MKKLRPMWLAGEVGSSFWSLSNEDSYGTADLY
jgi:hypothetical protein